MANAWMDSPALTRFATIPRDSWQRCHSICANSTAVVNRTASRLRRYCVSSRRDLIGRQPPFSIMQPPTCLSSDHAYETRHARETRRQASLLPDSRYQKIPRNRDIVVVKKRLELSCDRLTAECSGSSAALIA